MALKMFRIFAFFLVSSGSFMVLFTFWRTRHRVGMFSKNSHTSRLLPPLNNVNNWEREVTKPLYADILHNGPREDVIQTETKTEISIFRERFQKWHNANPAIELSTNEGNVLNSNKYLIYRCDAKNGLCGGWADRIKGAIISYLIANLTDRIFKLEMLNPACNLTKYLTPNLVDWSLPQSFHKDISKKTPNTKFMNFMDNRVFYNNISHTNFTEMIGSKDVDFVYFKANFDYTKGLQNTTIYKNELSWMKRLSPDQILATIFKHLFKPNRSIQAKLEAFLDSILTTPKHRLICVHIRMGRNPSIPNDAVVRNKMEHLKNIWSFLNQQLKDEFHKIFLMSDSEDVLKEALEQNFKDRIIVTPGKVIHIERERFASDQSRCDALEKVIFDQLVLMNCDVLMISKSGISRMSAYVRASDQGLFCLMSDGRVIPCKTGKIKDLYKVVG